MNPVKMPAATAERVKGMVEIRDTVRELIAMQMEEYVTDAEIRTQQEKLNQVYDVYTAKYGVIGNNANKRAFSDDSSYCLLCSLEDLNEDGTFREVQIYGKSYKGKELYDVLETYVRRAFYSVGKEEQKKGRDIMWYIWAAPNSPLFGKSKMSTFERYFIEDPSTHEEKKNAYYRLWENEEVVDNMLREFGLDPEKGHIINGHVPVHQSEGESPVKCEGKVIVIDGGFSKPYQKVTGIAGYTLIYNSYGLNLTAHEPFTSKADAVARETDIVSNRVAVSYMSRRQLVGDTDTGHALKERIQELIQLLDAYRTGIIKEKK